MAENTMECGAGIATPPKMDKHRPYNGQPHTALGKRGQTLVELMTMRDIADCIVIGILRANGMYPDDPEWDDVYKIRCDMDPIAAVQNALCEIEEKMGIYPNIDPPNPQQEPN